MTTPITKRKAFDTAPDLPVETYRSLAQAIKDAQVRQLPSNTHEDLLVMFEALQAYLISEDERITCEGKALAERNAQVEAREREVELKARSLNLLERHRKSTADKQRGWGLAFR